MDVGTETLGRIHAVLRIDEEWTARRPDGFTWWGHRLAHELDAGRPVDDDGIVLYPVTSRIPVLQDVRAPAERVEPLLGRVNALAISTSYLYEPQAREVVSFQRGLVHEQTLGWRPNMLAAQFMIQLCEAETRADWLAEELEGEVAVSAHPELGPRREPDEMLGLVGSVFRPVGQAPSRFRGLSEFESIFKLVERINAFSAGASEDGLAIEVPFGASTALLRIVADQDHPALGSGLGVFTLLPDTGPLEDWARLANWLNLREAQPGTLDHHLGSWCVHRLGERWAVGHALFIPSALYRPGLATDAATYVIRKLERINRLLNPDEAVPDVASVIANRLRRVAGAAGRPA